MAIKIAAQIADLISTEGTLRLPTTRLQRDQEFSIRGFLGRDIAKSRDPGIFRDGISLKFYPGILPKKYGISRDFLLSS